MSKSIFPHKKEFIISIHVIAWLLIFVIPIFFYSRSDDNQWVVYWWKNVCTPISFMIIFYVNYCWLIEKFVFANRLKSYITHNLVLIALLCGLSYCWQNFLTPDIQPRSVRERSTGSRQVHCGKETRPVQYERPDFRPRLKSGRDGP